MERGAKCWLRGCFRGSIPKSSHLVECLSQVNCHPNNWDGQSFKYPKAWEVCKGLSKHLPTTMTFLQLNQVKVFYKKKEGRKGEGSVVQEEGGQWLVHCSPNTGFGILRIDPEKCQARIYNKVKKCKSKTCTKHQIPGGLGLQCNHAPFGTGAGKSLYCHMHDNQRQLTQGPYTSAPCKRTFPCNLSAEVKPFKRI